MESISIFDMLKIRVGPSSSHTLGPWRAAERWIKELKSQNLFDKVEKIKVDLYGSISLTGKGHATELVLDTDPKNVKVPLDKVIDTMWTTAKDMHTKYKETSEGGLAVTVSLSDC